MEMNLQKYLAFVKTVECGSFTKASEILNYSQSGISRMIRDLEKDWDVCLLDRNHAGIHPTSDGLRLLPYAKNLCAQFDRMQMELHDLHGLSSGCIRIGTFSSIATHWLPNIIKAFFKDYPGIHFEIIIGDYLEIEDWIAKGQVDCGFLRLPASPDIETIFLEQDRLLAVLPENHYLLSEKIVPIRSLAQEPFLLLEKNENKEISNLFSKSNLIPDVRLTTWDDYAIMSMVEQGLGVGILPELILKKHSFRIITKELDIPAFRKIGFSIHNKKTASLAVLKFMEYLTYRYEK